MVFVGLGLPVAQAQEEQLVDIAPVAPRLRLDLRYATADNFLHKAVYARARCLLREPVAARLAQVTDKLAAQGYGLKVWDCYRPLSVQKQMWALVPDENYVANPAKGSRHNRGAAVDLSLVDAQGHDLEMPTTFDDFSPRAARTSQALWSESARQHYAILHAAMTAAGFLPLPSEWWHYDAPGWERYGILDRPL
ncbi:D-alanyl-D-alanine dipeptidase [Gloeobacter kilaueensis JS1]|uniref:D-alanyl-D-alanine dipeptidase n=2 Tax=Gloeobacter TaxID=33071 RepID=U5QKA4_GLOK1|nr:D-alanyl-D-alanine dipeptidase [Gloeobacter kilaueensis JS1]